jgi:hypothetical protein
MKTLKDLFELVAVAVEQNHATFKTWFVDYHGHVNKIDIKYYFTGWAEDSVSESASFKLDEDGIQGAYWFIKTKLK